MTDQTPFTSLLVANRGEIALRIMRTARAQGLRTIAVYSDADADAPHVRFADQALRIGPGPATDSYLSVEQILEAARVSGADAIHPGYGFLSENAGFARACGAVGLVFVGPSPEAIALMGDKAQAKARMIKAGVACIPGYEGADQSDAALADAAGRIGFPVMIKASMGGGGRGMRLVGAAGEFVAALHQARAEALSAFGSDQVILERAIISPRHVEVQVLGDRHGNVLHLAERDCSVQRRHQKIVEEAPGPAMTPELRAAMGAAAVDAARAVGYEGAGTVEFLLDGDGGFYFLEMNTRLQVEHPVTELITGHDLVALQLTVARGDPLGFSQGDVALSGHAIEVRLYAEDTARGFLPSSGGIALWQPPRGAGIRVDDGIETGQTVSPHYDPMLAKIIAHGDNRQEARARLIAALADSVLFGVASNRDYLIGVLDSPGFTAGAATTSFVDGHSWQASQLSGAEIALAAALAYRARQQQAALAAVYLSRPLLGWGSPGGLRSILRLWNGETLHNVDLRETGHGVLRVKVAGQGFAISGQGDATRIDGVRVGLRAHLFNRAHIHVATGNRTYALRHRPAIAPVSHTAGDGRLRAPMHGALAELCVEVGDRIKPGTRLAVLEAMKMRHELRSDVAGIVGALLAEVGAQVHAGDLLVEIIPDAD